MQSHRHERVRELLKREIGEVIRRELPIAEVGVITVHDVDVAANLQTAKVHIGLVGTAEQQKRALQLLKRDRKRIQTLVGHAVVLKYTPHLRFVAGDSVERGNRVLSILDDIERTLPPQ